MQAQRAIEQSGIPSNLVGDAAGDREKPKSRVGGVRRQAVACRGNPAEGGESAYQDPLGQGLGPPASVAILRRAKRWTRIWANS